MRQEVHQGTQEVPFIFFKVRGGVMWIREKVWRYARGVWEKTCRGVFSTGKESMDW